MDILVLLKALILGVVEGSTEFLPISSTGHLIVVGDLLKFSSNGKVFEVVIQLGAVLAVVFEYRSRFAKVISGMGRDASANRLIVNLAVAFMPAAIVGLLCADYIKSHLFNAVSVAVALVVGAIAIMLIERYMGQRTPKINSVDDMIWTDALKVGLAQIFALIPGTSRSGSTIMGGMAFGLSRQTATEFSFFLAVPVMFAATIYDVYKHFALFTMADLPIIAVGFVAAFISGLLAVRGLIRFVASHNFLSFAWYRIIFGAIILLTWQMGWVDWAS